MSNSVCFVGLCNPGDEYARTRHNAGLWCLEAISEVLHAPLKYEKKFHGQFAKTTYQGVTVFLLAPTTYMNHSGQAVRAVCDFYKLEPTQFIVIHDELDKPPGSLQLKIGGGHGGHNGLRDIHAHLSPDYARIRMGIGHPGHKDRVTPYVLSAPSKIDAEKIQDACTRVTVFLSDLVDGKYDQVMRELNQKES